MSGKSPVHAPQERRSQERTAEERTPQVTGELIATRRVGAYHHLTFVAPGKSVV